MGPEQMERKALLIMRGYRVDTATDCNSANYKYNYGAMPTTNEWKRLQMMAMVDADAVVVTDDMDTADVLHLMHVARFAGLRAVLYDELPAQCPDAVREVIVLDELDLLQDTPLPLGTRLRLHVRAALRNLDLWAQQFDARFGWFFTNGNKQHRAVRSGRATYANTVRPNTTA
jgi:hypothetical protein